ncbi:hypothetical protein KAR91_11320 [Candidatus Pacearchaeota archaeon]|nr:hypothetical protein [Candidatus Pacearchaeota archaeon]
MSETEIDPGDIKKPKTLAKKVLNNLIVGGGAAAQEILSTSLETIAPQIPKTAHSAGQMIIASMGAGAVKNKMVKNFIVGISAGAAKDLVKSIINFLTPETAPGTTAPASQMTLAERVKAMFKKQRPTAKLPTQPAPQGGENIDEYF